MQRELSIDFEDVARVITANLIVQVYSTNNRPFPKLYFSVLFFFIKLDVNIALTTATMITMLCVKIELGEMSIDPLPNLQNYTLVIAGNK